MQADMTSVKVNFGQEGESLNARSLPRINGYRNLKELMKSLKADKEERKPFYRKTHSLTKEVKVDKVIRPNLVERKSLDEEKLVTLKKPKNNRIQVAKILIDYLHQNATYTEGIFRISGQIKNVIRLKKQFLKKPSTFKTFSDQINPYEAANILLRVLKKMRMFDEKRVKILFIEMGKTDNKPKKRVSGIAEAISYLSLSKQKVLREFLNLLELIAAHVDQTKMNESSLARCIMPNFVTFKNKEGMIQIAKKILCCNQAFEFLICNQKKVFKKLTQMKQLDYHLEKKL